MKPGEVPREIMILDQYMECLILDEALNTCAVESPTVHHAGNESLLIRFSQGARIWGPATGIEGFFEPGSMRPSVKEEPVFKVLSEDVIFVRGVAEAVLENRNGHGRLSNVLSGRRKAAKAILDHLPSIVSA